VVRKRHAEDSEHRVADELLAEPAEPLDLGVDEGEQLALQDAKLLRVDALGERRRPGDVGEEDSHHAALVPVVDRGTAARGCGQRRASAGAERRTGWCVRAAHRAGRPKRRTARAAEAGAWELVGAARRARPRHRPSLWFHWASNV